MSQSTDVVFWRDAALPFVELRKVADGRRVCYAPHSHHEWSLGLITAGESTFVYGNAQHRVGANDLILINPETVHACNPIQGRAWGYLMLYIDTSWLTSLRYEAGLLREAQWQDIIDRMQMYGAMAAEEFADELPQGMIAAFADLA